MPQPRKAIALISGGLDSLLAAKVILDQGIAVEGINFFTGFCVEGHTHSIRNNPQAKPKRNNALWVAEQLGIPLHIVDVIEEYKDIVINPKYGYGANLNPCLDCKVFMVKKAVEYLDHSHHAFDFIITGEVIGQRPMSQRKDTMPLIAKQSGADDRLLRPLCAKNLPPTLPEREGWIDREQLLAFHGRDRSPQFALAAHYGFKDFATPAGGCCFLTDKNYANKLQDLWTARGEKKYEFDDIMLLKVGRHLRPRPHFKMIIGRDEGENRFLSGYRYQFISLQSTSHNGPTVLIDGTPSEDDLTFAARITARFGSGKAADSVTVSIQRPHSPEQTQAVRPLADIEPSWYLT